MFGGGLHAQLIEKNQASQMSVPIGQSAAQPVIQPVMQLAPGGGKFCHNCGSPSGLQAVFCNKCGAKLA
jgi:hypothetical protein